MSYAKQKKSGVSITPEQLQAERVRFFAEKRESFAINILCHLCHSASERVVARRDATYYTLDTKDLVAKAVTMADELMDKLYSPKAE